MKPTQLAAYALALGKCYQAMLEVFLREGVPQVDAERRARDMAPALYAITLEESDTCPLCGGVKE